MSNTTDQAEGSLEQAYNWDDKAVGLLQQHDTQLTRFQWIQVYASLATMRSTEALAEIAIAAEMRANAPRYNPFMPGSND
jgi:hypothetical protein